jgi:hypothetical protein
MSYLRPNSLDPPGVKSPGPKKSFKIFAFLLWPPSRQEKFTQEKRGKNANLTKVAFCSFQLSWGDQGKLLE